ncbi:hypothetical protein [Puniceibacterium confluentis]|uniref:hypothetical protein n=1 Tax=Puniceibacterium confluentis TaxID=1958944 RepID=UPI003566331F
MTQDFDHPDPSDRPGADSGKARLSGADGPLAHAGLRPRRGWYTTETRALYTLSRHWPVVFDLVACTHLPLLRANRLARQIRQDIWRELRHLRGFSPAVEIVHEGAGLKVRAGGSLMAGAAPAGTSAQLAALLNDPERRARWCHWARIRGQG